MNFHKYLGLTNTLKPVVLNKGQYYATQKLFVNTTLDESTMPNLKPLKFILDKNVPRETLYNKYTPHNTLIKQLNLNTNKLLITQNNVLVYFEEILNGQHHVVIINYDKIGLPTKLITESFIYKYSYDPDYTTVTINVIARHNKFETSHTRNIQPFLQDLLEYTKVQKNKIPRSK